MALSPAAAQFTRPENARPRIARTELHPPMRTPAGYSRGNYLGPRTEIAARLRRGDQPINFADTEAQAHDIRYTLARNAADVRRADERMIAVLSRGQKERLDYPGNLLLGKTGIQAKVALENLGVPPTAFTSFGGVSPADREMMTAKLKELEQRGFGRRAPRRRRGRR